MDEGESMLSEYVGRVVFPASREQLINGANGQRTDDEAPVDPRDDVLWTRRR